MNYCGPQRLDLRETLQEFWQHRRLFAITMSLGCFLSLVYVMGKPSVYRCEAKITPELEPVNANVVNAMVSTYGFSVGSSVTDEAVFPEVYPSIITSSNLYMRLFETRVDNGDDIHDLTYLEYMTSHQKVPWWSTLIGKVKGLFRSPEAAATDVRQDTQKNKPADTGQDAQSQDPSHLYIDYQHLSKAQLALREQMASIVLCEWNKVTEIVSLEFRDQDPQICLQMTDSLLSMFQQTVTAYHTDKVRRDLEHFETIEQQSRLDYQKASAAYADFVDANKGIAKAAVQTHIEMLEAEKDQKERAWQAAQKQVLLARERLQLHTPAYFVLKSPSLPTEPCAPKRLAWFCVIMFIFFAGTALWVLRRKLL